MNKLENKINNISDIYENVNNQWDFKKQEIRQENDLFYSLIKKSSEFLKTSSLQTTKNTIKEIFENKEIFKSVLFLDFMYSTNLSKNKYAIDDIVKYIKSEKFKKLSENIWEDTFIEISKLKFWLWNKKAISFFSKYFFYLTDFKFPIYDSLVIKSSKTIFNIKITENNFYSKLYHLTSSFWVSFEELDWFLWLFWKIKKWSFTTFLSKNEFIKLDDFYKKENKDLKLLDFEKILDKLIELKKIE